MGDSPPWNKITSKKYVFDGIFSPHDVYNSTLKYLDRKAYDNSELEVEMKNLSDSSEIFTHIQSDLEFSRRYYLRLMFSIKMGGKIIDEKKGLVDGNLTLYVNGFLQNHGLLGKDTPFYNFLEKFYDTYIDSGATEEPIVNLMIEIGGLMSHVKSKLHRR